METANNDWYFDPETGTWYDEDCNIVCQVKGAEIDEDDEDYDDE